MFFADCARKKHLTSLNEREVTIPKNPEPLSSPAGRAITKKETFRRQSFEMSLKAKLAANPADR